ncbi:hypothetical protein CK934_13605 [Chitinophaga sp. MD30]|nr:hypothetical protein CK934_13605 [Chitinophaga sp. MD30]
MRAAVEAAVAKKFDGDYNVLIKDLPALLSGNTGSFYLQRSGSGPEVPEPGGGGLPSPVDLNALADLLQQPVVVNADTLYPQIYIPFFGDEAVVVDEYDPCANAAVPTPVPVEPLPYPVVVPFDGDETMSNDVFSGYTYDANGNQTVCGNISECFAQRNRVWAVTFNERVDATGRIPSLPNIPTPTTAPNNPDVYFPNMTVKVHKESWIKGGSEIAVGWYLSWFTGYNPATGSKQLTLYQQLGNPQEVAFFSRKQVQKQTPQYINTTFATLSTWWSWDHHPYASDGDYMYLIIYELDNGFWEGFASSLGLATNNEKEQLYSASGNFLENIKYPSNEGSFITVPIKIIPKNTFVSGVNTSNFGTDNGAIKFQTAHR